MYVACVRVAPYIESRLQWSVWCLDVDNAVYTAIVSNMYRKCSMQTTHDTLKRQCATSQSNANVSTVGFGTKSYVLSPFRG